TGGTIKLQFSRGGFRGGCDLRLHRPVGVGLVMTGIGGWLVMSVIAVLVATVRSARADTDWAPGPPGASRGCVPRALPQHTKRRGRYPARVGRGIESAPYRHRGEQMFIAVTGGTGYLGAHTVKALLDAGHTVRLLVTPAEQNAPVLAALRGLGTVETHVGDVREGTDIAALLEGTDAVIHGAGVVGTDERRTRLMWDVNAYATESVLTTAVDLGLDPIVSVSSYAALFPSPTGIITPETPTAPGRSSYAKTKGYADSVARRLQEAGHPVVVTYPSSVVGP